MLVTFFTKNGIGWLIGLFAPKTRGVATILKGVVFSKIPDFHGQFQRFSLCSGFSWSISKIFPKWGVVRSPDPPGDTRDNWFILKESCVTDMFLRRSGMVNFKDVFQNSQKSWSVSNNFHK
jgi:hypothetical protein